MNEQQLANLIPDGPDAVEQRLLLNARLAQEKKEQWESLQKKLSDDYTHRVEAVLETARAYYRRGRALQYESQELVDSHSRLAYGERRASGMLSPEDATLDMPGYMVCSTFPHMLYWDVLGTDMGMDLDHCTCRDHTRLNVASTVFHWQHSHGQTPEDAMRAMKCILRPGDMVTLHKESGHCMLFLGDFFGDGQDYLMHSWGGKYNMTTGEDKYEPNGTLRIQTAEELLYVDGDQERYRANKISRFSVFDDQFEIVVLRPLMLYREEDHPLTANARARLAHPGLNIDRTCDVKPYRTVAPGARLTYTILVENHSNADYDDIVITERIPHGTVLFSAGDAQVDSVGLRWSVAIPAGGKQAVSYTVTVLTGVEWIVADGGFVAGIRSNCIRTHVGNVEGNAEKPMPTKAQLDAIVDSSFALFKQDTHLCIPKPDGAKCLVPGYWGGFLVTGKGRIMEFSLDHLLEGDIVVEVHKPLTAQQSYVTHRYLGDGKFITDPEAESREEVLWPLFTKDMFFVIRPALGEY